MTTYCKGENCDNSTWGEYDREGLCDHCWLFKHNLPCDLEECESANVN